MNSYPSLLACFFLGFLWDCVLGIWPPRVDILLPCLIMKTTVGMVILGLVRMLRIEEHELLLQKTWVLHSASTWGTTQPLVTPSPEDLTPSYGPLSNCIHVNIDSLMHTQLIKYFIIILMKNYTCLNLK